jgi:hypothetical protein
MLSSDPVAAAGQLRNKLRATVQALEALQFSITVPEHLQIIRVASKASVALTQGHASGIERSLDELDDAAAILAHAGDRAVA